MSYPDREPTFVPPGPPYVPDRSGSYPDGHPRTTDHDGREQINASDASQDMSLVTLRQLRAFTPTGGGEITWEDVGVTSSVTFLSTLDVVMDGTGLPLVTGVKGDISIDFDCTIAYWTLLADQAGSVVVDIWKDTLANYPPTVADTITGSAKPTLTSADHGRSSSLTGWTTGINAGDTLRFNIDSTSGVIIRLTLALKLIPL